MKKSIILSALVLMLATSSCTFAKEYPGQRPDRGHMPAAHEMHRPPMGHMYQPPRPPHRHPQPFFGIRYAYPCAPCWGYNHPGFSFSISI